MLVAEIGIVLRDSELVHIAQVCSPDVGLSDLYDFLAEPKPNLNQYQYANLSKA